MSDNSRFQLLYPISARACYVIQDGVSGFRWHYSDECKAERELIAALSAPEFKSAMTLTGIPSAGCQCDKGSRPAGGRAGEEVEKNMAQIKTPAEAATASDGASIIVPEVQNYEDLEQGRQYQAVLIRIEKFDKQSVGKDGRPMPPAVSWRFKVNKGKKTYDLTGIVGISGGVNKLANWCAAVGIAAGRPLPIGQDLDMPCVVQIAKKVTDNGETRTVIQRVLAA